MRKIKLKDLKKKLDSHIPKPSVQPSPYFSVVFLCSVPVWSGRHLAPPQSRKGLRLPPRGPLRPQRGLQRPRFDLRKVPVAPRDGVRDPEAAVRGPVGAPVRAAQRLLALQRPAQRRPRCLQPEAAALQEAEVRPPQGARVSSAKCGQVSSKSSGVLGQDKGFFLFTKDHRARLWFLEDLLRPGHEVS